ncbi:MAG: poly-gamma-glutamate synthesis protein involved in capsule biosynthesis [Actinomycetota bacterium]
MPDALAGLHPDREHDVTTIGLIETLIEPMHRTIGEHTADLGLGGRTGNDPTTLLFRHLREGSGRQPLGTTTMQQPLRRRLVATAISLAVFALCVPAAQGDDPPAPLRSFTLAATGDVIAHNAVNQRALLNGGGTSYDYRPMFAELRPYLEAADLAICNLEGPIAPAGIRYSGYPSFATPVAMAQSLRDAGFDRCSTANNHTIDKGLAGIDTTLDAFDAAGLGHSGTARTPEEAIAPILDVNGVRVAHLAYTYGYNGRLRPRGWEPWRTNFITASRVIADAQDARVRGAEVVIVSFHWGQEYRQQPTIAQLNVAKAVTSAGVVDLIIGHHAHVLQPIRKINGTWVAFGLGNIVSNQRQATTLRLGTQEGVLLQVTFAERAEGGFEVLRPVAIPTWVYPPSLRAVVLTKRVNDPRIARWIRRQMYEGYRRTRFLLGSFVPPLEPPPTTTTTTTTMPATTPLPTP